jgi:hypothetical protein
MHRPRSTSTFACVACQAVIVDGAVFHVGLPFCCADCVADGPCSRSHDKEGIDHGTRHPVGRSCPGVSGSR